MVGGWDLTALSSRICSEYLAVPSVKSGVPNGATELVQRPKKLDCYVTLMVPRFVILSTLHSVMSSTLFVTLKSTVRSRSATFRGMKTSLLSL